MKLIGFNFNKINIEKFKDGVEDLKINTNISILELKKMDQSLFKTKDELISIKFTYSIDYAPDLAKIELSGNLIMGVESKLSKEILNQWKDKKMPEDFKIVLFNIILRKSNIKALQFEEEMNLPLHLSLPFLRKQESESNKK